MIPGAGVNPHGALAVVLHGGPRAGLSANTTRHLVADIKPLRGHPGIERWLVLGGSWELDPGARRRPSAPSPAGGRRPPQEEDASVIAGGPPLNAERLVDQAAAFRWSGNPLEPGVGLALSGGGFRAMLFHAGALLRLNELGLLSRVNRVASVSGGSITAGMLARAWGRLAPVGQDGVMGGVRKHVVEPLLRFSDRWVDLRAVLHLLLLRSAASAVADEYDAALFGGATLQELPDAPAPQFVFCASNLQTGVLWRFTKAYAGDYLVGRLDSPRLRLSEAVAASSAFPPFLSPLRLEFPPGSFTDWPQDKSVQSPLAAKVGAYRRAVVLTDGGVYDNHGLEPLVKRLMTVFASDGGAPFARRPEVAGNWWSQLRRVLELEDNQVRSLRRRDLIGRFERAEEARSRGTLGPLDVHPHARFGAYWGIATDPSRMTPPGYLSCAPDKVDPLAAVPTRLWPPGSDVALRLVNWGYAICDRSVRTHYHGWLPLAPTMPSWPYPNHALE